MYSCILHEGAAHQIPAAFRQRWLGRIKLQIGTLGHVYDFPRYKFGSDSQFTVVGTEHLKEPNFSEIRDSPAHKSGFVHLRTVVSADYVKIIWLSSSTFSVGIPSTPPLPDSTNGRYQIKRTDRNITAVASRQTTGSSFIIHSMEAEFGSNVTGASLNDILRFVIIGLGCVIAIVMIVTLIAWV